LIDVAHAPRSEMIRNFVMCEFGSDHGVNGSGCEFYQTRRMSFTHLTSVRGANENESQWLCNRVATD
jgi:hypothetical protein